MAPIRHNATRQCRHSIFLQCGDTVLYFLPCYPAAYMLFVCAVMCWCIVLFLLLLLLLLLFGLLRPLPLIGSGLALTAARLYFVFILFSHSTMPRPLRPKMTARRLGPSGFPRQACASTSTSNFTPTATMSAPPTLTSLFIVNPSSTMAEGISKKQHLKQLSSL